MCFDGCWRDSARHTHAMNAVSPHVLALIAALCAGAVVVRPTRDLPTGRARKESLRRANNSSRGGRVNESIGKLWSDACPDSATMREQR